MQEKPFTAKMTLKHKIALELESFHPELNLSRLYWSVWYNTRPNGGFRLTNFGYKSLVNDLNLKNWEIKFKNKQPITSGDLVKLDRYIRIPYFLYKDSIVIFDGNIASQLILYDGDIHQFLKAQSIGND